MNKAELIDSISQKTQLQRKDVESVIETMLDTILTELKAGHEVNFTSFGAFSARVRKGRIGVDPRDPTKQIQIPPVNVPKFKAGKGLKESLKNQTTVQPVPATVVVAPAQTTPPPETQPKI